MLGFLPNIKVRTAFRDSSYVQEFKRVIMRACMGFLFKQLLDEPKKSKNFALGDGGNFL